MYIWAQIPDSWQGDGSLSSPSVSCRMRRWPCPRIGFGEYGDESVRFALYRNEQAPGRRCAASGYVPQATVV